MTDSMMMRIWKGLEMGFLKKKIIPLNDLDMQFGNSVILLLNCVIKAYTHLETNNVLFAAGLFLENTRTVL